MKNISKKVCRISIISIIFLTNLAAFQNCSKLNSESGLSSYNPNNIPLAEPEIPGAIDVISGDLIPIKDPNRPELKKSYLDEYELKYVESFEDDHLKLSFKKINNQFYLSDYGSNPYSTISYTLNGWTDMQGADQLIDEPIYPYRLYHITKWSAQVDTLDDWWKTTHQNPKAEAKRSELFFYLVKKGDNWNPVGQSNNPIGRPYAFSKLPAFKLKNRSLEFERNFLDETAQRKKELSITVAKENKLTMIYSTPLELFIENRGLKRGFHDFTKEECVAYADTLPTDGILAFDIEPPDGKHWIINYEHPNYEINLEYVVKRLAEKGAVSFDWLHFGPAKISLDGIELQKHQEFGKNNSLMLKFKEAYSRIHQIQKKNNYYGVIPLGNGYDSYDVNLSPLDEGKQNFSPQVKYIQNLNATELFKRVFPAIPQYSFIWGYTEYDSIRFAPNHIVDVPEYNAKARRIDNKPLYPPNQWEDSTMLSFINSKYTFYWGPGGTTWNPASVSNYNSTYTNGGFSTWEFVQGIVPQFDKFYLGKESLVINATLQAASNFSKIQDAADGIIYGADFKYKRANKDGTLGESNHVLKIEDGSWYMDALLKKQPFCIILTNNGKSVVLFQDIWSRPGRWTEFEFSINGKTYKSKTEGNRLFTALL